MDVQSWLRKQLEQASPDLLRAMVQEFAEALMGAEVDALCGAPYGERSPERVNIRNGYRERGLGHAGGDDRTRDPEARQGSYFPDWLLQPRRRAEQAFVSVIADAYLAGVSTRRVEKLVQQLGVERMSKSQVSRLQVARCDSRGLPHPSARGRALSLPRPGCAQRLCFLPRHICWVRFRPGGGAVWFCDRVLTLGGPEVMLTFCDALAVLLAGAAFSADA